MATPKRRKAAATAWLPYPKGGEYINYKGGIIVKQKGSYSVRIGQDSISAKSLKDARTILNVYSRSKQPPPFEWQFHHPVEGWYFATYMLGAIKKEKNRKYWYTTDHKNWIEAKNFADAKAKIAAFTRNRMNQFKK